MPFAEAGGVRPPPRACRWLARGLAGGAVLGLLGPVSPVAGAGAVAAGGRAADYVADYTVTGGGTGGGIGRSLTAAPGDPRRGREVVIDPGRGNCLICHTVPDAPRERFQGNLGPPLAGVGTRLSAARLRLRIVDGTRLNPDTVMPAYHRVDGLQRVAEAWRGRPVLSAAEVEDVVAYLVSLRSSLP